MDPPVLIPKSVYEEAKKFNWKELDGKSLEIHVREDSDESGITTVVAGFEKSTGKIYILRSEHTKPS